MIWILEGANGKLDYHLIGTKQWSMIEQVGEFMLAKSRMHPI